MKKMFHASLAMVMAATMTLGAGSCLADDHRHDDGKAKNIIIMVPDGMGISNVTAARIFKNGPNGERLALESLGVIGHQATHAANSTVTDSAAAATAWAIGRKANNGEISCTRTETGDCSTAPKTVLEIAKKLGKATGLVATSQISHATPAAFGAHAGNRYCGEEIARQYIEETGVDVVLGGGVYATNTKPGRCTWGAGLPGTGMGQEGIITSAINNGYTFVETESTMREAVKDGNLKVLGMFKGFNEGKTVEMFRIDPAVSYPDQEPTLAEMTEVALNILDKDKDGFFLMIEGSQIDWEDHANSAEGMVAETLGFDAAVESVNKWLKKGKNAKKTLLIVAPDHDTAGYAINGPYGTLSNPGEIVDGAFISGEHTATDVVIWSEGPGSNKLGKALDNTDLYDVMVGSMTD
ncbi:MAG: alkaline phosphatase [Proteobacteria bacterium]|nr:alkaline phosphatase [Pseudomonadota bacterium]MBU1739210.1 alkaline phosphatase [Pseudomonadota bacterium]